MTREDSSTNREAVIPTRADWRTQYDEYHVSPAIRMGDQVHCCGITGWDPGSGGYPQMPKSNSTVGELHEQIPTFVRVRDR